MTARLFAFVGAAAFAALTLSIFVLQLTGVPEAPRPQSDNIWEPDGDPLPAQLRACAEMSETALSMSDCRAVWAEKRRRFFRFKDEASEPAIEAVETPPSSAERQSEKDQ